MTMPASSRTTKNPKTRKATVTKHSTAKMPIADIPKEILSFSPGGKIKLKRRSTGLVVLSLRTFTNIIHGSPVEVIRRTREGLPASVFGEISTYLDMPASQLYDAVGVSRSTMATRIKGNQPLSTAESDKVVRIAKVLERAAYVLGDNDQARIWLRREIRSIGGVPPITMLDTEAGYELVMDTLGRIEQGIAA